MCQLHNIRIRKCLSQEAAETLLHSFVKDGVKPLIALYVKSAILNLTHVANGKPMKLHK